MMLSNINSQTLSPYSPQRSATTKAPAFGASLSTASADSLLSTTKRSSIKRVALAPLRVGNNALKSFFRDAEVRYFGKIYSTGVVFGTGILSAHKIWGFHFWQKVLEYLPVI